MNVRIAYSITLLLMTVSIYAQDGRVYRDHIEPHWLPGHTAFWYRNSNAGDAREFIFVDCEHGTRSAAFDHARVAAEMGKMLGREIAVDHLPVERLRYTDSLVLLIGPDGPWNWDSEKKELTRSLFKSSDEGSLPAKHRAVATDHTGRPTTLTFVNRTNQKVNIDWNNPQGLTKRYTTIGPGDQWEASTFEGHVWSALREDGKLLGVFTATNEAATAVIEADPTTKPAFERFGFSPDGKWSARVKDHNLYLEASLSGEAVALSTDGKADDAYHPDAIWWSPDSTQLVAMRTEPAQEHKIYEVQSSPQDQVQPKLKTIDYLKPGDRIAHPRPQLFEVATRKQIPISDALFSTPWSINDVRWAADGSRFTFVYNQRGHQALRVIAVDAKTGKAKAIIDETSKTFVDYSGKFYCHWIGDGEILWMSERDGWNHLWLYDAAAGRVKNCVTPGEWPVQEVVHVDESKRQVWFKASGVRPGQDPYYTQFCRVNLDGSNLAALTEGDGTHHIQWSPGDVAFIDTYSRVDQPPITELRRSDTGKLLCALETADASEVLAHRNNRWPERFTAKGRDDKTDIYGTIVFPGDFDPAKKYPVVENIYAGPQGFFTAKAFKANWGTQQHLADLGMIVVQCDGMGTSGRSKAFHDVCYKNLKDAGFPDRIAWIKAAAGKHPQMDLTRVGIYGGSAGGQNAMAALLWHHDFYKVAVADCGCHDNRMDKIWWNEQWMGWPIDKSYEESSNVANAHLLEGDLLLMVGELDTNVDPASTMQVVSALEKAGKIFDLVIVAGANHGSAETPYGSKRREEFLVRHLLGK